MQIVEHRIPYTSRGTQFRLYPLGDVHWGARNCYEAGVRRLVRQIADDPNARWLGGGDLIDAIHSKDVRFSHMELAPWLIRPAALDDICQAQIDSMSSVLKPIAGQCIGMIEGNHEGKLSQREDRNIHGEIVKQLLKSLGHEPDESGQWSDDAPIIDLGSSSFVRIVFERKAGKQAKSTTFVLFLAHGYGTGRRPGSEANRLESVSDQFDADVILLGHTHKRLVLPVVRLGIPRTGALGDECEHHTSYAANWGSWYRTYVRGAGAYAERKLYRPGPLGTVEIVFTPDKNRVEIQHFDAA